MSRSGKLDSEMRSPPGRAETMSLPGGLGLTEATSTFGLGCVTRLWPPKQATPTVPSVVPMTASAKSPLLIDILPPWMCGSRSNGNAQRLYIAPLFSSSSATRPYPNSLGHTHNSSRTANLDMFGLVPTPFLGALIDYHAQRGPQ